LTNWRRRSRRPLRRRARRRTTARSVGGEIRRAPRPQLDHAFLEGILITARQRSIRSAGSYRARPTACQPRASENRLKIREMEESGTAAGGAIPSPSLAIIIVSWTLPQTPTLPRWVHGLLPPPPLRCARRALRCGGGRTPPMDYLDNPKPRSVVDADRHAAGKERISTGVHSAETREKESGKMLHQLPI
jgi:hypothetical protein